MVRKGVKDNADEWQKKSKEERERRVEKARTNGLIASRVFDNLEWMKDIIKAIDAEDIKAFKKVCRDAGIPDDDDMVTHMWNATMGSLDPQGLRPCW
jgi:pyruvate carboxylase